MAAPKVGIIGGAGAMGSFMAEIFSAAGYKISVHDKDIEAAKKLAVENRYFTEDGETLAKTSDIVIWSVPIPETVSAINKYAPFMKEGSLATDVTSVKVEPVKAMLKSVPEGVEVIGMHPMFRPTIAMEGQKVVLTPTREESKWMPKLEKILDKEGAKIKITTPERHDKIMAVIQGLTHTTHIVSLETIKKMGYDLEELMEYASPVYQLFFELMARIISGKPELYGSIQTYNPEVVNVLETLISSLDIHKKNVAKRDEASFAQRYLALKAFVGDFAQKASKKIDSIVGKPKDTEIFFEEKYKEIIKNLIEGDEPVNYKGDIITIKVKSGNVDKLKKQFALARYTRYDQREIKEGTIAFYIRNKSHPASGKMMRLTPIITENPERTKLIEPDFERIQMYNKFLDPILNAFNTWERREELKLSCPLLVYKTPRGKN